MVEVEVVEVILHVRNVYKYVVFQLVVDDIEVDEDDEMDVVDVDVMLQIVDDEVDEVIVQDEVEVDDW